jgi:phosphoribosylformylglycinamidine synthase
VGDVGYEADPADGGRGRNADAVGLVVERDVAGDDGVVEHAARFAHAFDGADELPHDLGPLRVSEVEVVGDGERVGADPLAITDNLNFANPQRPEVMGQLVGAIKGMGEACRVLDYPVVSGNVSLYNETNGVGIPPTPAIGAVGLIPDIAHMADMRLKRESDLLIVIGREAGHLGQSLYQELVAGKLDGAPPPVDLADEIKAGRLVRALIREGKVAAVHDVSDGGLLVAVAEMALVGGMGVELFPYEGKLPTHAIWFGEDQGRYVLSVDPMRAEEVLERARLLALPARIIARTGGEAISLKGEPALALADLKAAHEAWLPGYMAAV